MVVPVVAFIVAKTIVGELAFAAAFKATDIIAERSGATRTVRELFNRGSFEESFTTTIIRGTQAEVVEFVEGQSGFVKTGAKGVLITAAVGTGIVAFPLVSAVGIRATSRIFARTAVALGSRVKSAAAVVALRAKSRLATAPPLPVTNIFIPLLTAP